ncbi:MAG: hypothetical protein WA701_09730 [Solirubrobacterales bacterium]
MSLRSVRLILLATAALLVTPSAASAAWTVTPTPSIGGPRAFLSGVDCSSANSCIAVGVAESFANFQPVVERWDGTSWQVTFLSSQRALLDGISCPQPSVCFAVGSTDSQPLIELWDGSSWSTQASAPGVNGALADVSCSGLLACTAVGNARPDPNTIATLAERWDGSGWHLQSTPNPTGSDQSSLHGVSCPLRRTCMAVGQSTTPPRFVTSPLVERWFGRVNAWGMQAAPQPEGAASVGLGDVSCPHGSRVCVVVGSSTPSQGQSSVLAARRVGLGSWSIFPLIALPGSSLSTVDCPGVRFCQATGNWGSGLIAERFDGTSWQVEGIPTNGLPNPSLADVSCPSRFFCMAVGNTFNGAISQTLAAKWTP